MDRFRLSRRGLLNGVAGAAGMALGTRLTGGRLIGEARAATLPSAVVVIHLAGGINQFYGSSDTMVGQFGVTSSTYANLGNGIAMDTSMASGLSTFAKSHMAVIGVKHGKFNHDASQPVMWTHMGDNAGLILAESLGGSAPIKAPIMGSNHLKGVPTSAYKGVSLQQILDIKSAIDALGSPAKDPRSPDRLISLSGLTNAQKMSQSYLANSPDNLSTLNDGYSAAIDTLKPAPAAFDGPAIMAAYGLGTTTRVLTFASKLAAAEVMIRSGATVITVLDDAYQRTLDIVQPGFWDIHHVQQVDNGRKRMSTAIVPALQTFITRMVQDPTRNVTVCITGDCNRSMAPLYTGQVIPAGDDTHAPSTSAIVIGPNVKPGNDGKVDANGRLTQTAAAVDGMWSYLAALAKAPTSPFGANPHPFVL